MILQSEIIDLAEKHSVPPSTIDKNWVLGHFIAELFRQKWAREKLIFKGGTCLKKCYFPDYRFSEDLDFTLTDNNFIITSKLLKKVCDNIYNSIGILFSKVSLNDTFFLNKKVGYEATIYFWGANHKKSQSPPLSQRWHTSIKLEFIFYEIIINQPILNKIIGDYSDMQSIEDVYIPCYSIIEIVAEKFRSLIQRSYPAPRDYYDLWYLIPLLSDKDIDAMLKTFKIKTQFKNVNVTNYLDFFRDSQLKKMKKAWQNSLKEHLSYSKIPDVEVVIDNLKEFCQKLNW